MAVFTVTERNSMLAPFDNTTVADDTVVNSTSGTIKLVQGTVDVRGSVSSIIPDYSTLITVLPGATSIALLDGDYYRLNEESAMFSTVPYTITTKV